MATGYLQGLLGENYEDTRRSAINQGLLSAGLQGLMASGPSLMPTSAGQILGQAGMAGVQAYGGAMDQAEKQGIRSMELNEVLREKDADDAFNIALTKVFQGGKIDYNGLQKLALINPERVGQVMTALNATKQPTAPSVNLQFDAKTGTVFNPRTGTVTRVDGFGEQAQAAPFVIHQNATPEETAAIYRDQARVIAPTNSAEAKRLNDLANEVDPRPSVKPPTDTQLTASGYFERMNNANTILAPLEAAGQYPSYGAAMAGSVPFVGDVARRLSMSPEQQQYQQAADDWIRSKLRKESGAVISDEEMRSEYNTYFPQPGDTSAVIAQKQRARQTATEAMRRAAGTAVSVQPTQSAQPSGGLAAQARAERERRQRGGQ